MAKDMKRQYKSTESKYKGGAKEMYITYDLQQQTRGDEKAMYPKVKRVYIAGDVKDWKTGKVKKRSGLTVHGVEINYRRAPVTTAKDIRPSEMVPPTG